MNLLYKYKYELENLKMAAAVIHSGCYEATMTTSNHACYEVLKDIYGTYFKNKYPNAQFRGNKLLFYFLLHHGKEFNIQWYDTIELITTYRQWLNANGWPPENINVYEQHPTGMRHQVERTLMRDNESHDMRPWWHGQSRDRDSYDIPSRWHEQPTGMRHQVERHLSFGHDHDSHHIQHGQSRDRDSYDIPSWWHEQPTGIRHQVERSFGRNRSSRTKVHHKKKEEQGFAPSSNTVWEKYQEERRQLFAGLQKEKEVEWLCGDAMSRKDSSSPSPVFEINSGDTFINLAKDEDDDILDYEKLERKQKQQLARERFLNNLSSKKHTRY